MTGVKGGVSGLMKNKNPMHCLAHRLALCTSQAATDIPALKGYQQIITDIYYYFSKSAKHTAGLKEYKTCLKVMYSRWKTFTVFVGFPYTMHFMPFTVPGVHLLHTLQHMLYQMPRPKAFLKRITQYEFIVITHFLMHIIPITTQLNLDFEKEDLDLAAVNPVVETTLQHVKVARQTSTRTQRENKAGGLW